MNYTVKRTRRKTLAIKVTRDMQVVVHSPMQLSAARIDEFVRGHAAWIATHLARQQARLLAHPPPGEDELAQLKADAAQYIPARVRHYAGLMGLQPSGVKITQAKTRWGSCSGKNSLCFSCRLMQYPPEAIDYVVVHELAHIRHKNHGAEFYALVAAFLPDWQARRALLRQ